MNRRDATLIARLDTIDRRFDTLIDAIAGLRIDHATHRHDDEG